MPMPPATLSLCASVRPAAGSMNTFLMASGSVRHFDVHAAFAGGEHE